MLTQHALQERAIRQDAEAARVFDLGQLWRSLCDGSWVVHHTFSTEERHLVLIQVSSASPPRPLQRRKLNVLESVLLGKRPKVVAYDSRRSLSSVTSCAQECLRKMGLAGREAQTTVLLTMAARASLRPDSAPRHGRSSQLEHEGQTYLVISVLRPDLRFPVALSDAEAAVLRSLLAGNSYAQISGARAVSPRTVANQLATAFKKLGVSGRRATIEYLIQQSAMSPFRETQALAR
jgi:DNA-binding NarL/FixJ family response regulator